LAFCLFMSKQSSIFKLIVLIFLIAVASGCFWSFKIFGQPLNPGGDEIFYDKAALNILEGNSFCQGFEGLCIEPQPLYPLFLSGVYFIFGHNYDAVRLIQIILFALTAVLVFLFSKKLFNRRIAVYAGLLAALFYPLANYSGRLYREVLFAFLSVLLIYCLSQIYFSQRKKWFVFSGIALGLMMLTNAVTYFLPLVITGNFLIIYRKRFFSKQMLVSFSLFILSLIIVFSPWLIRNYYSDGGSADIMGGSILVGRAYLIETLQGKYQEHFVGQISGYLFAKRLNPQLDIRQLSTFPPENVYRRLDELSALGYNQERTGEILQKEALSKIFKNPHFYFLSSFLYFISFNNPMLPNLATFDVSRAQNLFVGTHLELNSSTKTIFILSIRFVWLIFFFFVVYGAMKIIKNWSKFGWLILIIVYFNLVYSLLFAIPRYALPIYPFYIILFVYGLSIFWPKFEFRNT